MTQTKKLYLHIGITKTGSSAIQAYLSTNSNLLELHGIDYPFPEAKSITTEGVCTGNLLHMMQRIASNQGLEMSIAKMGEMFIAPIIDYAVKNLRNDRLLFSGEFISSTLTMRTIESISQTFSNYKITLICYVRDIYYHHLSAWKQRVKTGETSQEFRDFITDKINYSNNIWNRFDVFFSSGWEIRLVNYDIRKKDLIASFLEILGFETVLQESEQATDYKNISISFTQAQIIVLTRKILNFSDVAAELTSKFRTGTVNSNDPYFSDIDHLLLERYHKVIEKINTKLPRDQQLRCESLNDSSKTDLQFTRNELEVLLNTIKNKIDGTNSNRTFIKTIKDIPEDFDPNVYLLLNPDVANANVDPYYHYHNHGKYEGRIFK